MRRDVIETIMGVEIFPLISLVIFFGFFVLMFFWVIRLSKNYLSEMETMPLDESSDELRPAVNNTNLERSNGDHKHGN